MKLKNILIVVEDIEKSKKFYQDMFGLDVLLDREGNVILAEGLVLQEARSWKQCVGEKVISPNQAFALYFEETDIEKFDERLKRLYPQVTYVHPLTEYEWGQKVVRFYDPDGNLIEVRTPM